MWLDCSKSIHLNCSVLILSCFCCCCRHPARALVRLLPRHLTWVYFEFNLDLGISEFTEEKKRPGDRDSVKSKVIVNYCLPTRPSQSVSPPSTFSPSSWFSKTTASAQHRTRNLNFSRFSKKKVREKSPGCRDDEKEEAKWNQIEFFVARNFFTLLNEKERGEAVRSFFAKVSFGISDEN